MLALVISLFSPALGAVTCQDGQVHDTLAAAVANTSCEEIQLDPGRYVGDFDIGRTIAISGKGPANTFIVSRTGPCMSLAAGAELSVTGVTLASDGAVIAARDATIRLTNLTITPLEDSVRGLLRLFDTDAIMRHVTFNIPGEGSLAVDAVSGRGHDMLFERVDFLGTLPAPEGMGAVYALNYGVTCTDCTFGGALKAVKIPGLK